MLDITIRNFLEEQQDDNYKLINTRTWAMDQADKWFEENYVKTLGDDAVYDKELIGASYTLKDEYQDIFWSKVDEFEEELEKYQNDVFYERTEKTEDTTG